MSNLYQDAILDAKALRASAMANAKAALEEAFEPKIQEMMRLKLSEEFDSLEEDDMNPADIAADDTAVEDESVSPVGMEENMDINEAELEEILAQLEELAKDEEPITGHKNAALDASQEDTPYKKLQEADNSDEDPKEEDDEDAPSDDDNADEETGATEEVTEDTKVIDITVGELKEILQSVMAGAETQDLGMDQDVSDAEAGAESDSEISLEEILAELEMEESIEESAADLGKYSAEMTKEVDTQRAAQFGDIFEKKGKKEKEDGDAELEEAKATIETLRQNLQEVNLLNAKYLYMNKLFKSKSLTESQKVKVINALDRATNVAEVKNTYETLKESFSETKKTQLKESIGFASQAAGVAPKANIVDADPFINRWQTLAGISKRK